MRKTDEAWKIGEAKQRFSTVVRDAAEEPQRIYNRDRLVAAVVGPEDLAIIERHRSLRALTLGEAFAEASYLAGKSDPDYILEIPDREDRPNPLLELLDER